MAEVPKEFVFNGINGRTGKYLLTLTPTQLEKLAAQFRLGKQQQTRLRTNQTVKGKEHLVVRVGLEPNNLAQMGWGLVFPAGQEALRVDALLDHLKPLIDLRAGEAGQERVHIYRGADGCRPGETADKFMRRHGGAVGIYDPDENHLPYYLLLVGGPQDIPFQFQYELDVTYLVGRLDFGDDLAAYAQYAQGVAGAQALRLPRRAVLFGTSHAGDSATEQSARDLVAPLAEKLGKQFQDQEWTLDLVAPGEATRSRLEELLGHGGEAPALLFTATHGVGFDAGDELQEGEQGALLCQVPSLDDGISRDDYLAAENVGSDCSLHGLIAFHFACFGAGTPQRDSFSRVSTRLPKQLANRDFTAALPRRLLSHPRGGALAVVGHVDRAWTYSFKWGENRQQTATFQDTLARLMLADRVGVALDSFNLRYSQIAVRLTERLNDAQSIPPIPFDVLEAGSLWTANNDARGYALLGDPAVRLPVAARDEPPGRRREPAPPAIARARVAGIGDDEGGVEDMAVDQGGSVDDMGVSQGGDVDDTSVDQGGGVDNRTIDSAGGGGGSGQRPLSPAVTAAPGGGVTIQVSPEGQITLQTNPRPALPAAADLGALDGEAFDVPQIFRRKPKEGEAGEEKGLFDEAKAKLKQALETIGQQIIAFADDITTLQVRTFVSDAIEQVTVQGSTIKGDLRQRAVTTIKLDGDTDIVVPVDAGEIDQALWEIHTRAVEQAQAHRAEMLRAVGDLIEGIIPKA